MVVKPKPSHNRPRPSLARVVTHTALYVSAVEGAGYDQEVADDASDASGYSAGVYASGDSCIDSCVAHARVMAWRASTP